MTVAGQESVAELADLLRIHDDLNTKLANAYAAFSPAWVAKDPAAFEAWTNDWNAYQARYQKAHDGAEKVIDVAKLDVVTPDTLIPAQGAYDAVMKALEQNYPPDGAPRATGDFADLVDRLSAAGADVSGLVPLQPTPGIDADLNAMNNPGLNAAANAGGALVRAAAGAANKAKSFLTSPWAKVALVGGSAGLVLLLVVALRSSKAAVPMLVAA